MNFRRWITALAVLTLFVGLAAAQTSGGSGTAMTCETVSQVTPTIRSEGVTELVGDIVITCQGGDYIRSRQRDSAGQHCDIADRAGNQPAGFRVRPLRALTDNPPKPSC